MKRLVFGLALMCACLIPTGLFAQGAIYRDVVIASTGRPIAGAQITVCTSTAVGIPCAPTATIYTNETLVTPKANPTLSDGLGNYTFALAAGTYVITITGNGMTGSSFRITAGATGSGSGTVTSITAVSPLTGGVITSSGSIGLGNVPVANLNSGTGASATTFWRGDGTWATPAGAGTLTASGLSLPVNQIMLGNVYPDTKPLGSLGTTTTLLHGNAGGAPTFGAVVSADLNITTTTCTNQFLTAISSTGVGTCTTDTLASAQHANQGTTTTLLHGNAAGNPSFAAVSLTADITGNLPVGNLNSGTGASGTTFWRGDGTWATPAGSGNVTTGVTLTANRLVLGNGTQDLIVLGSLGTTTTLLHGNAAGAPTFGAVASGDLNITSTTCTNQFLTAISSTAVGTCTTATLASAQFANQGTTTTVLHGNAAGNPAFNAVVSGDLNITTTTCTNQFVTAISAGAVGTCTTDTLASAQHANQGTTTTVLHGNAAGNPSFTAVSLTADVSGNLPVTNLNSGTAASSSTFWRGDGTWATPAGSGNVTTSVTLTANRLVLGNGTQDLIVLGSLGTTTTLLHGNAAGAPTFGAVVSGDLNITTTTCTNQFVTAISSGGVGTCTTDTLASAQHANQGTTTTVLHGNAAGNPAFSAVSLSADVTGNLPVGNLNSGTSASSSTFWRGDGTWATPSGTGNTTSTTLTTNRVPKANGANSIIDSSISDDGTTVSTTLPISTTADGTHPGYISFVGNTTAPTLTANTAGIIGPSITTFTNYALQLSSTAPTTGQCLVIGTVASNVAPLNYNTCPSGTVTSIATTSPITGGTITTTGTIACATCVTSAAALTSNVLVKGGGGQATSTSLATDNGTTLTYTGTGGLSAPILVSTVSTGTAPLTVTSTTNVANLNASSLGGATFAAPGAIGGGTPSSGAFTTLSTTTSITGGTQISTPIFLSNAADPADSGAIRLGNAELIAWEASPASTDVTLTVNTAEQFVFSTPLLSPALVTPDIGTPSAGVVTNLTGTLTNIAYNVEGTGNTFTMVHKILLAAASCNEGTASLMWDAPTGDAQTAPTEACNDTGAIQRPTASFSGSAVNGFEQTFKLPTTWTGNIDLVIRYVSSAASPTGNVEWDISTVCRAVGETWDGSYNTIQTITDAQVAQNTLNDATQTSLTTTGCAAGEDFSLRVSRDGASDSSNDVALMLYAEVTLRTAE